MDIEIICIGKIKENYFREATNEYAKRLSAFCNFRITELPEFRLSENPSKGEIEKALKSEGESILKKIPKKSCVFALCIEGNNISSEKLAEKINDAFLLGKSSVTFVIGSSYGLSGEVKNRADFKLSFGKMTFPHQMFRVMLTEQIYRSFQILKGGKYHK
ncbi:MAG: 23S rRNA (pseudouridine(1915)-N(3))-methyltransferase RlmH [Acutalibacteraceae bacterium]